MIKINLLSEAKPTKKKRGVSALGGAGRLNLFLILGGLLLGLLVVGVQWWVESSRLKEQEEKNRLAQQEVTRLEAVLKEVQDFEDKKAKLQKKVDLINSLKASQRGPVRLMDEVSNALPDLLWLERMEVKGELIEIDGKALNPPAVANFFTNLQLVPAFQEPKLTVLAAASTGAANLYNYQLSFVFADLDRTQFETAGAPAGADGSPAPVAPAAPTAPAAPAAGK
jgi:type IV pilus assembly protein PilN